MECTKSTVEPGLRNLRFRAQSTDNQICFYDIMLSGFSALLFGFRGLNHGNRDWLLNPGCTVYKMCVVQIAIVILITPDYNQPGCPTRCS